MEEEDELVCDECGTLNDANARFCELCNDPLAEEKESKRRRALLVLLPIAVVVTAAIVWAGAVAAKFVALTTAGPPVDSNLSLDAIVFSLRAPGGGIFWVVYAFAWGVGFLLAPIVEPKDRYDLGTQIGPFMFDRPFDYSDDRDRAHLTLVILLLPVRIVRQLWLQVYDQFTGREHRYRT